MASFFNVNPQLLSQLGGSVGNIKQAPIGDIVNAERDRQFKQQATLQELDIQKQGLDLRQQGLALDEKKLQQAIEEMRLQRANLAAKMEETLLARQRREAIQRSERAITAVLQNLQDGATTVQKWEAIKNSHAMSKGYILPEHYEVHMKEADATLRKSVSSSDDEDSTYNKLASLLLKSNTGEDVTANYNKIFGDDAKNVTVKDKDTFIVDGNEINRTDFALAGASEGQAVNELISGRAEIGKQRRQQKQIDASQEMADMKFDQKLYVKYIDQTSGAFNPVELDVAEELLSEHLGQRVEDIQDGTEKWYKFRANVLYLADALRTLTAGPDGIPLKAAKVKALEHFDTQKVEGLIFDSAEITSDVGVQSRDVPSKPMFRKRVGGPAAAGKQNKPSIPESDRIQQLIGEGKTNEQIDAILDDEGY